MSQFSDRHREILVAVCDTVVPSIAREPDPSGFFARKASDLGVPDAALQLLAAAPPEQVAGLGMLLDALDAQGFTQLSQRSREQVMRNLSLMGPEPAAGIQSLVNLALFLYYGLPDQLGAQPQLGDLRLSGPDQRATAGREADQAVYAARATPCSRPTWSSSAPGAGGGVMAGVLAQQGLQVVVLEAGGYFDESDFLQLELAGLSELLLARGPDDHGRPQRLAAGRCLPGRRHDDQLDQLIAHDAVGARAVGA